MSFFSWATGPERERCPPQESAGWLILEVRTIYILFNDSFFPYFCAHHIRHHTLFIHCRPLLLQAVTWLTAGPCTIKCECMKPTCYSLLEVQSIESSNYTHTVKCSNKSKCSGHPHYSDGTLQIWSHKVDDITHNLMWLFKDLLCLQRKATRQQQWGFFYFFYLKKSLAKETRREIWFHSSPSSSCVTSALP